MGIKRQKTPKLVKPYFLISKIQYPLTTETQHTLITGGSGTGKTQTLLHLINQIKQRGDKAIIYDKMGSFIPYFYNQDKDTILNPFDKRSPNWSIFSEARNILDFDSIACAMIPLQETVSDPFWVKASRTLFANVANQLKKDGITLTSELVNNLLKNDLSDIYDIIKDTPARTIIDPQNPKTALSVMSVLSSYLSSLQHLSNNDNKEQFCIRDWIQSGKGITDGSCLFISSRGDQHESLKPLISTWLEIAINSLLSLPQDRNRRIWIILDELPSLHYLPSLTSGIAESRQFGGCFVLSTQLMAQLRSIYGRDKAETISGLCKTRIIFSTPDTETATYNSRTLGNKEQIQIREGISYGAHEMRDGVNLSTHQTNDAIVSPTEIMDLPNLESYIKLPFNFPISKVRMKPFEGIANNQGFIMNDTLDNDSNLENDSNSDNLKSDESTNEDEACNKNVNNVASEKNTQYLKPMSDTINTRAYLNEYKKQNMITRNNNLETGVNVNRNDDIKADTDNTNYKKENATHNTVASNNIDQIKNTQKDDDFI